MTASSVRIDRLVEGNIRRVIARNDAATGVDDELGLYLIRRLFLIPAVVAFLDVLSIKAIGRIGENSPAF